MQLIEELKNQALDDKIIIQNHIILFYIINLKVYPPIMDKTDYLLSMLTIISKYISPEVNSMLSEVLRKDPIVLSIEQKEILSSQIQKKEE